MVTRDPAHPAYRANPLIAGRLTALLATAVCLAPSLAMGQALPTIQEVMDHLDDLYRAQSSHAIMTMNVVKRRGSRSLTLESWSVGRDQALIVIREPAREAGTATLRTEQGLWNYAPRADRMIRIPPGLLSENWMGSHFTNDDILRETSYLDDHTGTLQSIDVEGQRRLRVVLVPHAEAPVVYTRLVFEVSPDTWIPHSARFFDGDKLIRSITYDRVGSVGGRQIPMQVTLQPADDPEERTIITYDSIQFDVGIDADMFTRRGLRRVVQDR